MSLLSVPFLNFFMKRDEFLEEGKRGLVFSFFLPSRRKKRRHFLRKSIHTHAQILSEANFAKQRRFGVLFTQRRGVLFRTRRRQRSRGALGTRRVLRFSFFFRTMCDAIRRDLFRPRERREIPFRRALTLSPLFFLSLSYYYYYYEYNIKNSTRRMQW